MNVCERRRIDLRGAVQGVGFRPFVYRLAAELNLRGWVMNTSSGLTLEVEGTPAAVATFVSRVAEEAPAPARVHGLEQSVLDAAGHVGFEIRTSDGSGARSALILPDIALCRDCRAELWDPADRRYRYPFINCTHCGPRFSIVRSLPYDRPRTTMSSFEMCNRCRREYEDPSDRRFHAQPNACPDCGPQVQWLDAGGVPRGTGEDAMREAVEALRAGLVVAVKGLGGFHLMADARGEGPVERLRERKHREAKPLAVMAPDLGLARSLCRLSAAELRLLQSPESPIVLLRRRETASIAEAVAPGNPELGLMLPYTPLHEVLLRDLGFPVVATSGNRSDEPICMDDEEVRERLGGIADGFLIHDRPIERRVEDSVARVVAGRDQILRRGRGYAPLPVPMPGWVDGILAVGGHLKNAVAVGVGHDLMLGPHIGDLDGLLATLAFERMAGDLQALYGVVPRQVACDRHPDYRTTRYAEGLGLPIRAVQHHVAHLAAVAAESEISPPLHGVAWDGTGYGDDGSVWGGEFFDWPAEGGVRRMASLLPFPLPGGEAAVREPRRAALGVLAVGRGLQSWDDERLEPVRAFSAPERRALRGMVAGRAGGVSTTSMGRLFDAFASLLGLCHVNRYEGEAAMTLEHAADPFPEGEDYPFAWVEADGLLRLDWRPLLDACLADRASGAPAGRIAAGFHSTLAEILVSYAGVIGADRMILSGGCFQNRRLTEEAVSRLQRAGVRVYWPQRVPPGDGGLAVGQAAMAAGPSIT